jgi:hypothetical protein
MQMESERMKENVLFASGISQNQDENSYKLFYFLFVEFSFFISFSFYRSEEFI